MVDNDKLFENDEIFTENVINLIEKCANLDVDFMSTIKNNQMTKDDLLYKLGCMIGVQALLTMTADIRMMNVSLEKCQDKFTYKDIITILYTASNNILKYINAESATPALGNENEWYDDTESMLKNDVFKDSVLNTYYKDNKITIPVTTIEHNIKSKTLIRLNRDNDLIIDTQAITFIDHSTGEEFYNETSLRFVNVPYTHKNILIDTILVDNTIYYCKGYDNYIDLMDQIVFNTNDADEYCELSPIPFYMFDQFDIKLEEEYMKVKEKNEYYNTEVDPELIMRNKFNDIMINKYGMEDDSEGEDDCNDQEPINQL